MGGKSNRRSIRSFCRYRYGPRGFRRTTATRSLDSSARLYRDISNRAWYGRRFEQVGLSLHQTWNSFSVMPMRRRSFLSFIGAFQGSNIATTSVGLRQGRAWLVKHVFVWKRAEVFNCWYIVLNETANASKITGTVLNTLWFLESFLVNLLQTILVMRISMFSGEQVLKRERTGNCAIKLWSTSRTPGRSWR